MTSISASHENSSLFEETETERQQGIITTHALLLDLVSALAGDRLLTKAERRLLNDLRKKRGPEEIIGRSLRDGLTGLFNHTYFYQQLDFEIRRYQRYGTVVSLALIDIDDFKMVREGDCILAAMGETLMSRARATDICCRYGEEKLAVILPSTEAHEA